MMALESIEERRPAKTSFGPHGEVQSVIVGKPLIELKLNEPIVSRDTQGVRIDGVWFVPACQPETYELNRLWRDGEI